MTELAAQTTLVDLDVERRRRRPHALKPEIVVALDDTLYAFLPARRRTARSRSLYQVKYVPLSRVSRAAPPDITLGRYVSSAPDRRLMVQTAAQVYEFDQRGRVYVDGELLWSGPLSAYGAPRSWLPGMFQTGEEAALLFVTRESAAWHCHVHVSRGAVVLVGQPPRVSRPLYLPSDWLHGALLALPRMTSEGQPA